MSQRKDKFIDEFNRKRIAINTDTVADREEALRLIRKHITDASLGSWTARDWRNEKDVVTWPKIIFEADEIIVSKKRDIPTVSVKELKRTLEPEKRDTITIRVHAIWRTT
jgi:hypothetical protein